MRLNGAAALEAGSADLGLLPGQLSDSTIKAPFEVQPYSIAPSLFLCARSRYAQALHDAEHALSLRPEWGKAWGRKGAAHQQLRQYGQAAEAYCRSGLTSEAPALELRWHY